MALSPTTTAAPPRDGAKYVADDEPNVSPEEQAMYDMAWNNALEIMYPQGDESRVEPEILNALKVDPAKDNDTAGGRPEIMALASAAVAIVSKLDDSSREAGKPLPDDILAEIGKDVVEELGEIAGAANIFDYTEEDLTGAFVLAVDMYRPKAIADGRTTEDTLKQQFGMVNEMDEKGQLGEIMPGLAEGGRGEPPVAVGPRGQ